MIDAVKNRPKLPQLLVWPLLLFLLFFLFFPGPARADGPGRDQLVTGLIDGRPFSFSLDSLRSRTACLLVFRDGEGFDLLHYRQDEKVYTASLTKIMTAWLAYDLMEEEGLGLDDRVQVLSSDLEGLQELNASLAGFEAGESVTYRDLFHGLLISSGCDAANTLARVTAGSTGEFVVLMNEKAVTLKLAGTRYANATGLFHPDNYGTARDVAVLLGLVLENPFFREVMTVRHYRSKATSQHPQGIDMRHYLTYYSQVTGIDSNSIEGGKTGQLKESGYCLASFKEIQGLTFVLCTTGADEPGGHLTDHVAVYQALAEQLPEDNLAITGIGDRPVPTPPPAESEAEESEEPAADRGPQAVINMVSALLLGTLALLLLFLFFSLVIKRKIEKDL